MTVLRTACVLLLVLANGAILAQVPHVMNYQGRLTDNSPEQNPVDATLQMEFRVYDAAVGGTKLWTEFWNAVDVDEGIFSVLLGSNGTPLDPSVFDGGGSRYLDIKVGGEQLSPRQQIGSAAFAEFADTSADAEKLAGLPDTSWQRRVSGGCGAGSSIRTVFDNGTVLCEADSVGITTENDPKVGVLDFGSVPAWNGSTLQDGNLENVSGNIGVGDVSSFSPLEDLHVFRGDGDVARIYATGSNQGSGMLFAGQSATVGGGMAYDGDGVPALVGGTDRVTFFRRESGADFEVMSYPYNGNDVTLTGNLEVQSNATIGKHPNYTSAYAAFWRDGSDYALLSSDSNLFLNAPAADGSVYVRTGNTTKMSISGLTGEVDVPNNLDVGGQALIGWERRSAAGSTGTTVSTCTQGGASWNCYQSSVVAQCSSGKKLIGGGCNCSGVNDTICYSYPSADDAYTCFNAEDSPNQPFTAYAICARVGS